ncbi:hypothetical protein JOS77_22870 [Chromobacterium haemolyticum]|nr:hypothetical protein JOS77_22870 [Chromobacterium haemolyticum]
MLPWVSREGAQQGVIGVVDGFHIAEHQDIHPVAHRQLHLRHAVVDRQLVDHLAQRHDQVRDMTRQNVAFAHVGDVGGALLVEAHQHAALFLHQPRRHPRAVAVMPGGAGDGCQHLLRLDPADAGQIVFQHPLLDRHLGGELHMLHRTAAAGAVMRTARLRAQEAFLQHLAGVGVFVGRLLAIGAVDHGFIRQRAIDEDGLAVDVGDSPAFVVQRFDLSDSLFVRHGVAWKIKRKAAIFSNYPAARRGFLSRAGRRAGFHLQPGGLPLRKAAGKAECPCGMSISKTAPPHNASTGAQQIVSSRS